MQAPISSAQAIIKDCRTAPAEIDQALLQCLVHSRPVRITIPDDMVELSVPCAGLANSVEMPEPVHQPQIEDEALSQALSYIYSSRAPVVLVDGESRAFRILEEIEDFVKATSWPTFTTGFGKSLISDTMSNVYGVFTPYYKNFVDSCDLIICFGPHYSNTNSYLMQTVPREEVSIEVTESVIRIRGTEFRDFPAKHFIQQLMSRLDFAKVTKYHPQLTMPHNIPPTKNTDAVAQKHGFWGKLSSLFQEGDVVLAETGTAGIGSNEFVLPPYARLIKHATWHSIGFTLPAALGASLAQSDLIAQSNYRGQLEARTILFIGDGSFQMTVQELSTIIYHKLDVTIFLINNSGYTIERCLHGMNQKYNDISNWQYLMAPAFFNAPKEGEQAARTWQVHTWEDLEKVLTDTAMRSKGLRMVEIFMEKLDGPEMLLGLLERQTRRL